MVGRIALLGGVVAVGTVVALLVTAGAYLVAAAAVVAGCVALLGGAWMVGAPRRALPLLLVTAVAAPLDLPWGLAVPFVLCGLLCAAWLLHRLVVTRRLALDGSRLVVATLVFAAVAVVAFVVGQYPWFPTSPAPMRAQLGGLALFLLSAGLLLVVGHEVASFAEMRRLTWLFCGLGAAVVVTQMAPAFEAGRYVDAAVQSATIGSMFWTWLVAMSVAQGLFNRELSRPARAAFLGIGALALGRGVLFALSWASGWLPPLIVAATLLFLRFPRTTFAAGLILLAPALAVGDLIGGEAMAGERYSLATRIEAVAVIGQLVERNPWLGFGPANYYHYTVLFPILGWWVRFNSHNNYVDLVAQVGLIGLLAFGWLVFEAMRLAVTLRRRLAGGFARAYAAGVIAGLAGSLVAGLLGDWIIPFSYNVGIRGFRSSLLFWFFLGGLLAFRRMAVSTSPGSHSRVAAAEA